MSINVLSREFEKLKDDLILAYDAKGMRASGKFANGLRVETVNTDTGYTATLFGDAYAQQLETGRQAGKFPPIQAIQQWIIDKGVFTQVLATIKLSSLAFLIARKIKNQGWKREGFGGVNLISEVVTDERLQMIIDEVGGVEAVRISDEIIKLINELDVA